MWKHLWTGKVGVLWLDLCELINLLLLVILIYSVWWSRERNWIGDFGTVGDAKVLCAGFIRYNFFYTNLFILSTSHTYHILVAIKRFTVYSEIFFFASFYSVSFMIFNEIAFIPTQFISFIDRCVHSFGVLCVLWLIVLTRFTKSIV